MKAIGYSRSHAVNDPQSLHDVEIPKPVASGRDLLVRVEAVSVNPVDTKVRQRQEPADGDIKVLGWDVAGVVESVKAASDIYSPVNGEVIEVNVTLEDSPETVNADPYEDGWLFRVKPSEDDLSHLLDAASYDALCEDE